jgi:hypothetical protein
MRTLTAPLTLFFIIALAFYAGCSDQPSGSFFPIGQAPCARFSPARIDVLPITSLAPARDSAGSSTINVYVCLLDSFDSQIKSPAVFRFELFERAQRSADPKGKRLAIWPDIDLTDPAANNNLWQDFMRSYLFSLPLQSRHAGTAENCILHVTCFCPSGRRLSADFLIRSQRTQ